MQWTGDALIIKVKLLNSGNMHGMIVVSGSSKFILYSAILSSLAFEYL